MNGMETVGQEQAFFTEDHLRTGPAAAHHTNKESAPLMCQGTAPLFNQRYQGQSCWSYDDAAVRGSAIAPGMDVPLKSVLSHVGVAVLWACPVDTTIELELELNNYHSFFKDRALPNYYGQHVQ